MDDQSVPHRIVELVKVNKEVSVDEAARTLDLDKKSVMQFARILNEAKIVDIFYAVAGGVILKPGLKFEMALEESTDVEKAVPPAGKVEENVSEENQLVDDFLATVRKKIMKKKQGKRKPKAK